MTPADLRYRIALARNNRHRVELVDPYVHALAELSILAEAMLLAMDRCNAAGDRDLDQALAALTDADVALRAVLPLNGESRIVAALQGIGADALPRPDWQARVLARVERPSCWRRLWGWLSW